jgi:hypothetical protein
VMGLAASLAQADPVSLQSHPFVNAAPAQSALE